MDYRRKWPPYLQMEGGPQMSTTPRTDAYEDGKREINWWDFARTLETELAAAQQEAAHYMSVAQKATDDLTRLRADNVTAHQMACAAGLERDQLRSEVKRWQAEAEEMSAQRSHNANQAGRLRAELAVAQNWVEHHSKHADDLIGENVKLRAEVERLKEVSGGYYDSSKAWMARAERAEAMLAEAKVERETVAEASLRSLEAYIDKLKQFAERAEKAEAALADWSLLNTWGGTPEIIHEFIKGQQNRIHHCQDLEAECLEQARLLGMSGEREADLLGKIDRLNRVIERASVKFFHDGSDRETAAKMLTVLNEAK